MKKLIQAVFILLVFNQVHVNAAIYFVPGDYITIQQAIFNCSSGDTIIVNPGVYLENINFLGKNLVLTGTDPENSDTVASTIINGYSNLSTVTFANGEGPDAVITGFTITGGYGTVNADLGQEICWGGGIYCFNSSPTITRNVIMGNRGPIELDANNQQIIKAGYGGGIGCLLSNAIVTHNVIKNNSSFVAGGIITYVGNNRIINNLICDNSGYICGGVVLIEGDLINNTIVRNNANAFQIAGSGIGGNLYMVLDPSLNTPVISNNIISDAVSGGGVVWEGTYRSDPLAFNNVWGNNPGDYGIINSQTGQASFSRSANKTGIAGNISLDPLYVSLPGDDYHLQIDSPCINAGSLDFISDLLKVDMDGQPRVFAEKVDMGAYEYVGYIKPVANAGPDQHVGRSKLVTLEGSVAFVYDPTSIITYEWSQLSGPQVELNDPASANPTFIPVQEGEYLFELVVSDGMYASDPDQVLIVVRNRAPVANAGPHQSFSEVPQLVTLDGSGSSDPDDEAITYRWKQLSGVAVELSDANAVDPSFVPADFGVYVFELVVSDGLLDSAPDIVAVVIGNNAPYADAGTSRYAGNNPVVLDGTNSFDPDEYAELTFQWRQISGPALEISNENTATPTISGFAQTNNIQRCQFEMTVTDGELTSNVDKVEVIIVPEYGTDDLVLANPPFNPNKPTFVAFSGGDCNTGGGMVFTQPSIWLDKVNFITVETYGPPYSRYGDMLTVFLSSMAPDYTQPIQTAGFSTGNMPAIDAAIQINKTYNDGRFAVNCVSLLDAACRVYTDSITQFLANKAEGEICRIDNYFSTNSQYYPGTLNIRFPAPPADHSTPANWYIMSADPASWPNRIGMYNGGVTAGYFISVAGPGRNLRLSENLEDYYFEWDPQTGYLKFHDQGQYPAIIPEAVLLLGPDDGETVDSDGAFLSCRPSSSAAGYQLLFGATPDHMNLLVSDTPNPPTEIISIFPFETTYWTVRVYDEYGSSIHTTPSRLIAENVSPQIVENQTTGRRYDSIQSAIDAAKTGQEIVVYPGIYQHFGNINFKGKAITVRSSDPNDSSVVASTIINSGLIAGVTFAKQESAESVLSGFTITGGNNGISCDSTNPTIEKCIITGNVGPGIKMFNASNPTITNCIIAANTGAGIEMTGYLTGRGEVYNFADITNCSIADNLMQAVLGGKTTIRNSIIYNNGVDSDDVQLDCDLATVTYSDVQDSWEGTGNIDADPLFADPANDDYHLKSQAGRWDPASQTWIQDNVTSPCVDAGDPGSDVGMEPEPNGSVINMGAYGGTTQASKSP